MSKQENKGKDLVGLLGENIAASSLTKLGHIILKRNYRKKYGEIDIISYFENKIIFTEVKTSQYYSTSEVDSVPSVDTVGEYEPEMRVTATKMRRMRRMIQVFMEEFPRKFTTEYSSLLKNMAQNLNPKDVRFNCAIISVKIDPDRGVFRLKIFKDVVI